MGKYQTEIATLFRSEQTIYHKYIQFQLCLSKYGFIQYQRYQDFGSYVKSFISGKLIRKFKNTVLNVIACCTQDNKYIAVNVLENTINIINFTTSQIMTTLIGYAENEYVRQMQFTDDNKYLVSISDEAMILWNLTNFNFIKSKLLGLTTNCVRFSLDGQFIMTAEDSCIRTRDLKTLNTISTLPMRSFERFRSINLSPNGKFIIYHDFNYIYIENYQQCLMLS